ncbi:flagellin N-terminal helical domain-containing protein [Hydrogenovibrio kuenenii]|uniref:flagellin N-terminal helical domain-containing protein n=1 Tax=Hydrogenovibrio kuenenii TaxID=63658 RepID=UPI0004630B8B|nr:flagellin [Hydrogenovibrio kuenenii]
MALVINTNLSADNAVRLLNKSQAQMSTSMERLTSGLRINKTADDAAGKAVATQMTEQIRGTTQAVRNANDGISLIQTVDGAAEETVNMLQRVRELAIQSTNGTYTSAQRSQMDTEVSQLKAEINRVASTTKFNGVSLMASTKTISIWAGWETGSGNMIKISLSGMNASQLKVSGNVRTQSGALALASQAKVAISYVTKIRSKFGAAQNRLDYTISNLQNVNQNITAARSQIQDANFAAESANLARTQILQQAGMSMLSQANQSQQNVLSLLR